MNIDIKGVHVEVTDQIREYIDKKLHRLDFVSEHIIDLLLFVSQEGSQYILEATINFRWGNSNKELVTIRWRVERMVRQFASRQRPKRKPKKGGRSWTTWSSQEIYNGWGLFSDYRVSWRKVPNN